MAYNKDVDYQALINSAALAGDYEAAGAYERQRNEKIDGEGLSAEKTNKFQNGTNKKFTSSVSSSSKGISTGTNNKSYAKYNSQYAQEIADMMSKVLNRDEFSYDPETDDTYKQYEKSYTKAGKRAMQDTLGDVASRTGGIASSYAASAASQAYDNYMSALADKIPELKKAAYEMYNDEYNRDVARLGILQGADDTAFNRYLQNRNFDYQLDRNKIADTRYREQWENTLQQQKQAQANADRAFKQSEYQFDANRTDANNKYLQETYDNNLKWNQQFDYQQQRDKIADERDKRDFENENFWRQLSYDLQKSQLEESRKQQIWDNALTLWREKGYTTDEIAAALGYGITPGTATASQGYNDWYKSVYFN